MMNMKSRKAKQGLDAWSQGWSLLQEQLPSHDDVGGSHHQVTTAALAFDTHKHLGETGHLMGIPSHPLNPPFLVCLLPDVFSL